MVYQQYRRIVVDPVEAVATGERADLDFSVHVRKDRQQNALVFDATLWNLSTATWTAIQPETGVQITLGWADGPQSVVCLGTLGKKWTESDGSDTKYRLQGVDASSSLLNLTLSRSWTRAPIQQIARDIATSVDLTPINIDDVDGQFPNGRSRTWSITDDKSLSYWLDQLVSEAEVRTDEPWEWRAERGKFWFEQVSHRSRQAATLSYDNTLVTLTAASEEGAPKEQPEYEFETLCEPRLSQGGLAYVDTDDVEGAFKVTAVEHQSNTTTGVHRTTGTLAPTEGWELTRKSEPLSDREAVEKLKANLRQTGALSR